MEWCRLYANLDDDVRVQRAEHAAPGAAWLLIQCFMYCTRAESQAVVPPTQMPRFGASFSETRLKALVSEGLLIDEPDGHLIDPDIWTEERNLSDAAEIRKAKDRERQRRHRQKLKGAADDDDQDRDSHADVSRDNSVTGHVRVTPHRREEKNYPPNPPQSGGDGSRCAKHQRPRGGCAACALPPLPPVPDWCGECSKTARRLEGPDGEDLGPCPKCHPSTVRRA